jgi:hypothetical protein
MSLRRGASFSVKINSGRLKLEPFCSVISVEIWMNISMV